MSIYVKNPYDLLYSFAQYTHHGNLIQEQFSRYLVSASHRIERLRKKSENTKRKSSNTGFGPSQINRRLRTDYLDKDNYELPQYEIDVLNSVLADLSERKYTDIIEQRMAI